MQLNRRISERRRRGLLWEEIMSNDRLEVGGELSEIGGLIRGENRESERTFLLIMHKLAGTLDMLINRIEKMDEDHKETFSTQQKKIEEHQKIVDKGQTSWRWFTAIVSCLSMLFLSVFSYGYFLIADVRDTVRAQQAVEDYINKTQSSAVVDTKKQIIVHAESIGQIQQELDRIGKLRSVAGSK